MKLNPPKTITQYGKIPQLVKSTLEERVVKKEKEVE
jgi:hypothetical protein